jgi:hypothetical protein
LRLLALCIVLMAGGPRLALAQGTLTGPGTGSSARVTHVAKRPLTAGPAWTLVLVAQSGDEPPGRVGETFSFFSDPSLDDAGRVAFRGRFDGPLSGNEGIYVFDSASGVLSRVVDDSFSFHPPGQGGATSWSGYGPPVLVRDGGAPPRVLFWGTFSFGDNSQGLYLFQGATGDVIFDDSPLQPVPGQPGANGFSTFPFSAGVSPFVSDSLHTATTATWFDAGFVARTGLYVGDVGSGLARVADETTTPPGQPGAASFSEFDPDLSMNGAGDVAFHAQFSGGIGAHGVYRYDRAGSTLLRVADPRTAVPGLPGAQFNTMSGQVSMIGGGRVAFRATTNAGEGIYAGDGVGPLQVLVDDSGAHPVPDHPGKTFGFFGAPVQDALGDVVVFADYGAPSADQGLFRHDGAGLTRLFDFGDEVPDQPGASFSSLGHVHADSEGGVAFTARYNGGVGNEGLYVHTDGGLHRVLDESDTSLGLALSNLHMTLFTGGSGGADGKTRALNARGDVALRVTLASGDEAIVLALRD